LNVSRDRLLQRATFGRVAASYTDARPDYPHELIADLCRACGIGPGARVLEVGPGTGQLTLPLAKTGARILAVELGEHLASVARDRLSGYGNVDVQVADFDSWTVPTLAFDVVVAATSFHWLDPGSRARRCHSALRPGGRLAVVDTRWGVRTGSEDPFRERSQACYVRWDPDPDPDAWHPSPDQVPIVAPELESTGLFRRVEHSRYIVRRSYTREQFVALANTYSTVQSWSSESRKGFLSCIGQLIDEEFDGLVQRDDLYQLNVAFREGPLGEMP
jgi:SAM-dependent methyltransferase